MKKILVIFLIAIVACETAQDINIEGWWSDIRDRIEKALKDAWDTLSQDVKDAINWLKEKGIYDTVKEQLVGSGKTAAIGICTPVLGPAICGAAIEGLAKLME